MTIQITRPEVEALINQRLQTGEFKDAEDVVHEALQFLPSMATTPPTTDAPPAIDIVELFAPLRSLDLDFGRNPSSGRSVDLSAGIFSTLTSRQNSAEIAPTPES